MKHQILNQSGYKISTANRKEKVGGGIALTGKDKINMLIFRNITPIIMIMVIALIW